MTEDKAGQDYWNAVWADADIPGPVDPADPRPSNYVERAFHALFQATLTPGSANLLEVGCGRSRWLPYFAQHFGFTVTGLDYSEEGCAKARRILARSDVCGHVIQADLFRAPHGMQGQYDVVVSFGLVEHFDDTAATLAALSRFLRPGGTLVTSIPNMTGIIGVLQCVLNRDVYKIHNPISCKDLAAAYRFAGLTLAFSDHFLAWNWNVVNIAGWRHPTASRFASRIQSSVTKALWLLEGKGLRLKPNRLTSPYIVCIGTLPETRASKSLVP